jgi:hypothetical protein
MSNEQIFRGWSEIAKKKREKWNNKKEIFLGLVRLLLPKSLPPWFFWYDIMFFVKKILNLWEGVTKLHTFLHAFGTRKVKKAKSDWLFQSQPVKISKYRAGTFPKLYNIELNIQKYT